MSSPRRSRLPEYERDVISERASGSARNSRLAARPWSRRCDPSSASRVQGGLKRRVRQGAECTLRWEPTGGRGARCVTPTADRKAEPPPETRGSCPFCRGNGGGRGHAAGGGWSRFAPGARPSSPRAADTGRGGKSATPWHELGVFQKTRKVLSFLNFCSWSRLFCCRCSHVIRKKGVTVFAYSQ